MNRRVALGFAVSLALQGPPWGLYAQAAETPASSILERWGVSAEDYAAMTVDHQARFLRGLALLDAGRRLQVEKLRRLAGERWADYVAPNGRLSAEGRALIARAEMDNPSFLADLDPAALGLDPKAVQLIETAVAEGAPSDVVAGQAQALFDRGPASDAKALGELATAAVGAAGANELFKALALKEQALAGAAQARTLGAAAKSLAVQAQAASSSGNLAQAQALGAQAQKTGAQAMAQKNAAMSSADGAHAAADRAETYSQLAGIIAVIDGSFDLRGSAQDRAKLAPALDLESSYRDAYGSASAGVPAIDGAVIARAYARIAGGTMGEPHARALADAVNEALDALTPEAAAAAFKAASLAAQRAANGLDAAAERQVIGATKVGAGAVMIFTGDPLTSMAASAAYLLTSGFQHRERLKGLFRGTQRPLPADAP